jgi:hypothetical protein
MSFNGLGVGVAHGVEFESSQGESPLGFFFNYFYFYFFKKGVSNFENRQNNLFHKTKSNLPF